MSKVSCCSKILFEFKFKIGDYRELKKKKKKKKKTKRVCFPVRVHHVFIYLIYVMFGQFLFPRVQPESKGKDRLKLYTVGLGRWHHKSLRFSNVKS